jgi:hypothetical protein
LPLDPHLKKSVSSERGQADTGHAAGFVVVEGEDLARDVALGREALAGENPVTFIDDGGDVKVLVSIDPADDEGARRNLAAR